MYYKIIIIGIIITLFSCNNDSFKTSDTGIEYKFIVENTDSTKLKIGDIVIMDLKYTTENDSVLFNSLDESRQFKMRLKKSNYDASIDEGLTMMHIGDSAIFKVNAMEFYAFSRGMKYIPDFITPDNKIIFYVKVKSIMNINSFKKESESVKLSKSEKEIDLLNNYIQKENITVEPTSSGLYYIEKKEGKGAKAKIGDTLIVHYTGKFIDGQIFDTSHRLNKPIEFIYGQGNVIKGWQEGLSYMKKGGKAQFIIPSHLAYGSEKAGPIPPYSTLVFDIEIVDIKN